MSIATAIARFRTLQAAQFTQTATIRRPVGEPDFDPDTGDVTQAYDTIGTALPCKVTSSDRAGFDVDAAQTQIRKIDHEIKFAVDQDVAMDDLITIDTSTYNAADVGRAYRVVGVDRREWQIARRCAVEETLPPLSNEGS